MARRISDLLGPDCASVERAATTLYFCKAMARIELQDERDVDALRCLARMVSEAVHVFKAWGVPLPGQGNRWRR
jgi:hypothetical protein